MLALGGLGAGLVNFLPRVKQPVLMLNGRYDFYCPVELCQEPFYRLLGSGKDQKKHLVYDSGHMIPRYELIKAMLDWLDQYLGPVTVNRCQAVTSRAVRALGGRSGNSARGCSQPDRSRAVPSWEARAKAMLRHRDLIERRISRV